MESDMIRCRMILSVIRSISSCAADGIAESDIPDMPDFPDMPDMLDMPASWTVPIGCPGSVLRTPVSTGCRGGICAIRRAGTSAAPSTAASTANPARDRFPQDDIRDVFVDIQTPDCVDRGRRNTRLYPR
jgi:hypothetical protein